MFREKRGQKSLFSASTLLPEKKRRRLERTWAWPFRTATLPLIDESLFRHLYHEDNGRPNKPVQTVIGLLLLKEMWDLTDEETLFNLDFNLAYQVALDVDTDTASVYVQGIRLQPRVSGGVGRRPRRGALLPEDAAQLPRQADGIGGRCTGVPIADRPDIGGLGCRHREAAS